MVAQPESTTLMSKKGRSFFMFSVKEVFLYMTSKH